MTSIRLALRALVLLLLSQPLFGEWQTVQIPNGNNASPTSWYRCRLQVPDRLVVPEGSNPRDLWRSSTMLVIADLPTPFQVFLNTQPIIESEGVPMGSSKRFKVPKDILLADQFNTLVIQTTAAHLTKAPMVIDYFHELQMGPEWEHRLSEPTENDYLPVASQPAHAAYTRAAFRLSATPLASTIEPIPGKRLSPGEALAALETDDDLIVEQLLHEPQIAQPTHFSFDGRGRLWVSQYRQYPYPKGLTMVSRDQYYRSKYDRTPPAPPDHEPGADIISVHQDTNGDGFYDSQVNVLTGLNMANAALRGWGGFWVMHTPYLLFYPDADGDDVPDGPPEVRLSGFGLEDTHSVANGLAWGPDGWLYGAQGSTAISRVVRPDVDPPDSTGIYNEGCHVWRYHPLTKDFETFADGGGNIFGVSFDGEGRLFIGHNGGDTRGWHLIQGGQYLKQGKNPGKFGPPPNPYAFGELPMMRSSHPIPRFSNMTIAVGGTAMPERFRGQFLGVDPLHHYLVAAERRPLGSSFETTDIGFPLRTDEVTFRPVYLNNAPDGSVVVADFCEEYIAHGQNYQGQIDPSSGRLYRIRAKDGPLETDTNLEAKSSEALLDFLDHPNLWHRQTAVRLLGQRADVSVVPQLEAMLKERHPHPALEALWTLHQMRQLSEAHALRALEHPVAMVRAWSIRLLGDSDLLPGRFFTKLLSIASEEPSPEVRCQILSTVGRLKLRQAFALILATKFPEEDERDPFIPLMLWFAIEARCETDARTILELFQTDRYELWERPVFRSHIIERLMRRFAEAGTQGDFSHCATLLASAPTPEAKQALLRGFEKAFEGRIPPPLPDGLVEALGKRSLSMGIGQGEPDAIERGLAILVEVGPERLEAIRAFGTRAVPAAQGRLLAIATDAPDMEQRRAALVSLQIYSEPVIARTLTTRYADQPDALKAAVLNLLASRSEWAAELIQSEQIPREDLTSEIQTRIRRHHPDLLPAPAENNAINLLEEVDALTTVLRARPGDAYRGEALYENRCGACHKLFFKGGQVGPDLTRYQRDDLSTLLPSILAPSAEIREGYENVIIQARDGRILSGFLAEEGAKSIVLRGIDGSNTTLDRQDIEDLTPAGRSLMPDGLLNGLDDQQLRDLFAYLRISQPISR